MKFIRRNPDAVREAARVKGVALDVDALLALDEAVRAATPRADELRQERKALSKRFVQAAEEERAELGRQSAAISDEIKRIESTLGEKQARLRELLLTTPGIPDTNAPVGPDASANVVLRQEGARPSFDFEPLDHVELLRRNGWSDMERTPQIAGSRTYSLQGNLARLELALAGWALDRLAAEGFTIVTAPPFAREFAFTGSGHFPDGREDVYRLQDDDLFLVGTSEVFLNALHGDQVLEAAELPILYAGYSTCYRREAGSAGRDVRGLLRVHHFTKVEQFVICRDDPEESMRWHARLLGIAESILSDLELPYQVVECSTGDMGLGKYRMNDVEAWVPSLGTYRETHSCSTLHDWQARRTNTRWRAPDQSIRPVHTLNNTAIATPRIFAALLEVHQRKDGRVTLPKAIRPYMGGAETL